MKSEESWGGGGGGGGGCEWQRGSPNKCKFVSIAEALQRHNVSLYRKLLKLIFDNQMKCLAWKP